MKSMIYFFAGLLMGLSISMAKQAHAGASDCYTISWADARAYCLARVHADPSRCYAIQQADMRAMCLAEVRK